VVVKAHVRTIPLKYIDFTQGVSHTPSGGWLIPQLSHNTPRLQGERKEREEGEGGGKGRGEEKGRDPQGLVDTPHVSNPEKYPDFTRSRAAQRSTAQHTCERTLTHWDGY